MGQSESKNLASSLKTLLKQHGLTVRTSSLQKFLDDIDVIAPWFLVSGRIELPSWKKLRKDIDRAQCEGLLLDTAENQGIIRWALWHHPGGLMFYTPEAPVTPVFLTTNCSLGLTCTGMSPQNNSIPLKKLFPTGVPPKALGFARMEFIFPNWTLPGPYNNSDPEPIYTQDCYQVNNGSDNCSEPLQTIWTLLNKTNMVLLASHSLVYTNLTNKYNHNINVTKLAAVMIHHSNITKETFT